MCGVTHCNIRPKMITVSPAQSQNFWRQRAISGSLSAKGACNFFGELPCWVAPSGPMRANFSDCGISMRDGFLGSMWETFSHRLGISDSRPTPVHLEWVLWGMVYSVGIFVKAFPMCGSSSNPDGPLGMAIILLILNFCC